MEEVFREMAEVLERHLRQGRENDIKSLQHRMEALEIQASADYLRREEAKKEAKEREKFWRSMECRVLSLEKRGKMETRKIETLENNISLLTNEVKRLRAEMDIFMQDVRGFFRSMDAGDDDTGFEMKNIEEILS
jgi:uncharacterized coiled-coil protein SlyX